MHLFVNNQNKMAMSQATKQRLFYKKECDRTRTEKLIRDIVCYAVVLYAAIMGYMLINANVNLANAQAELISNQISAAQAAQYN